MASHRPYKGLLWRNLVDSYSYNGWQGDLKKKTVEQNRELTGEDAEHLLAQMRNVPICIEHGDYSVGTVSRAWREGREVFVEFDLNDNASDEVRELVDKERLKLSWTWDWQSMAPLEVSLVWEPFIPGTCIQNPLKQSPYIEAAAQARQSQDTMAAPTPNAETNALNGSILAPAAPANPAKVGNELDLAALQPMLQALLAKQGAAAAAAAPVADASASEKKQDEPMQTEAAAEGAEGTSDPTSMALNLLEQTSGLTKAQRQTIVAALAASHQDALSAKQAAMQHEAALKESQNRLVKLEGEAQKMIKSKQQSQAQVIDLFEKLVKNYSPEMLEEVQGTREVARPENGGIEEWIHSNQRAIMACSALLGKDSSKAQQAPPAQARPVDEQEENIRRQIALLRQLQQETVSSQGSALAMNSYANGVSNSVKRQRPTEFEAQPQRHSNAGWVSTPSQPVALTGDSLLDGLFLTARNHGAAASGRVGRSMLPSTVLSAMDGVQAAHA